MRDGVEVSVTVRRLRGDEVSAERVEVKEPGGREGGMEREGGQQGTPVRPHEPSTENQSVTT